MNMYNVHVHVQEYICCVIRSLNDVCCIAGGNKIMVGGNNSAWFYLEKFDASIICHYVLLMCFAFRVLLLQGG